jgi:hypothetical protein
VLFTHNYAELKETSPVIYSEPQGDITFNITRLGLEDGDFTVWLDPISEIIETVGDTVYFTSMDTLEQRSGTIPFSLISTQKSGTLFKFLLSYGNGEFVFSDTVTKVYGQPEVIFSDDCSTLDNWVSPNWNIITSEYFSPPSSFTDSPDQDYLNNSLTNIYTSDYINIPENYFTVLSFKSKWDTEERMDYVLLQANTLYDDSTTLNGRYSIIGNNYLLPGHAIYSGIQQEWVNEEIDLTKYAGENVRFQFKINTNDSITADGFYFDDFEIKAFMNTTDSELINTAINVFPNPTYGIVNLELNIGYQQAVEITVTDYSGKLLKTEQFTVLNTSYRTLDLSDLSSGIYFLNIKGEQYNVTKKIVIRK